MRRLTSLLIVLCMVFSMAVMTVSAETSVIGEIAVEGIVTPVVGAAISTSGITIPEDANYVAESIRWLAHDGEAFASLNESVFGNRWYHLEIVLKAKEGYTFADYEDMIFPEFEDATSVGKNSVGDTANLNIEYDLRKEIPTVELTYTEPAEGATFGVSDITVPENADYAVSAVAVYDWEGAPVADALGKQHYQILVDVQAKEGFRFGENTQLTANGAVVDRDDYTFNNRRELAYWIYPDLREQVSTVELSGFPVDLTLGQTLPVSEVKIPETAGYELLQQGWYADSGESAQTAEKGRYVLSVVLGVPEGTVFAEHQLLQVKVDGQLLNGDYEEDGWYVDRMTDTEVAINREYELRDVIDTAAVTGIPAVEAGKAMDVSGIKIPENANYELTYAAFESGSDEDDSSSVADTFQPGQSYTLQVVLTAKEGYRFSEDLLATADGGWWDMVEVAGGFVTLFKFYEVAEDTAQVMIDKIELTGSPVLEVGKEADLSQVKIPENANYAITEAYMVDDTDRRVTVPENGRSYVVYFLLEPKEGYAFSETLEIYEDGEFAGITRCDGAMKEYSVEVSFKKQIEQLTLTGAPVAEIGKNPVTTGITAVETEAVERIEIRWKQWDYNVGEYVDFTGPFAAGNVYARDIAVWLTDGWELDAPVVSINGEEIGASYGEPGGGMVFRTEFSLENKQITAVDLVITPPEVGKPFNYKNIQLGENANCYIYGKGWYGDMTEMENVFKEDGLYCAYVSLKPDAGYVFSEDPVITVNGKNADIFVWYRTYIMLDLEAFFDTTVREDGSVAVREGKIRELIGNAPQDATGVTLDLSGTEKSSVKIDFPASDLMELTDRDMSLTVVTDTATVTQDAKTVKGLYVAAGEDSVITLEVKYIDTAALTAEQQTALKDKKVADVISAQMLLDGMPVADFGGGKVTVSIPFTPAEGTDIKDYSVKHLSDEGVFTEQEAEYSAGKWIMVLNHFSEYVVLYTAPVPPTEPPATTEPPVSTQPTTPPADKDNPQTGDTFPLLVFGAVALLSLAGVAVTLTAKKRMTR